MHHIFELTKAGNLQLYTATQTKNIKMKRINRRNPTSNIKDTYRGVIQKVTHLLLFYCSKTMSIVLASDKEVAKLAIWE